MGCIAPALASAGHDVSCTRLYAGESLPSIEAFDALIVMGGPMNVDERAQHPWLAAEQAFIAEAIAAGRRVLGICLGAQLIARALGAPVTPAEHVEIGWFELNLNASGQASPFFAGFSQRFTAFHWHGDMFAPPAGAPILMSSQACAHQAYALRTDSGAAVVGIQFHLEVTAADAQRWFGHERPQPGRYVQSPERVLAELDAFADNNRLMLRLLANWLTA
nr:type 1 glutamine amidotransferase [Solimonas marina]